MCTVYCELSCSLFVEVKLARGVEKKLRLLAELNGVRKFDRLPLSAPFSLSSDYQCRACSHYCYHSYFKCTCTKSIVCLDHLKYLCACPRERVICVYRYSIKEMKGIMNLLKSHQTIEPSDIRREADAAHDSMQIDIGVVEDTMPFETRTIDGIISPPTTKPNGTLDVRSTCHANGETREQNMTETDHNTVSKPTKTEEVHFAPLAS